MSQHSIRSVQCCIAIGRENVELKNISIFIKRREVSVVDTDHKVQQQKKFELI